MDWMKNLTIGSRLALGFGAVLALMIAIVVLAATRFTAIDASVKQLMEDDWVKAEAAHVMNATTRTNARKTMELFFVSDANQLAAIRQHIEQNKKIVSESLTTLDNLVKTQAGRELLDQIKKVRSAYVASFTKVDTLIRAGKRDEASKTLLEETLPHINNLQEHIATLVALEKKRAEASGIDMERSIAATRSTMIVVGVVALLLGAACAWWLTSSITQPIMRAALVAEQISEGRIGHDLAVRAHATHDECERLLQSLRVMDQKLNDIVGSVSSGADNVGSAARQLAQGNDDLSQRTQEQASALEEIAATMEQLTATVKRNSDNAHQADQLVHRTRSQADSSAAVAQQTFGAMEEINNSSRKISDIINVIDEIAFQTNLLALNAAVEAARAGEQGRGFAVVATEVRNLAQRSASAAKEIKLLISDSVDKVRVGTELVNASGKTLSDLVAGVNRITDVVAEIASASTEQAASIAHINVAMTQMDSTTQQNAALVEEAASASKAMENQAHELVNLVGFFHIRGAHAQASRPQPGLAKVRVLHTNTKTARQSAAAKPVIAKAVGDASSWSEF